jgi:hypothetical protein
MDGWSGRPWSERINTIMDRFSILRRFQGGLQGTIRKQKRVEQRSLGFLESIDRFRRRLLNTAPRVVDELLE